MLKVDLQLSALITKSRHGNQQHQSANRSAKKSEHVQIPI
ncbi:hypothetical protein B4Q23_2015 [Lacticaseibacillus paracasei]|nr:hypothetical protein AC564_0625c [Lacticaseibacillus paracasei]OUC66828.1 hypothetical protein BLL69_2079 [Lacticaseibacillus paracasei]OUC71616.1 hypothetical protein B4Q23_2015 [Lacticaseibacillus paracasei]